MVSYQSGTANGVIRNVVAWNVTSLMVKGDKHIIANNTVFDGSKIHSNKRNSSLPFGQTSASTLNDPTIESLIMGVGSPLDARANANTLVENNFFDLIIGKAIAHHPHPDPQGKINFECAIVRQSV